MSRSLRDFLVDLAADPDCLSQFVADPSGALDRAGLTAEEKAAVLSRDSDRLRGALGASPADHLTHVLTRKKKGARKPPGLKKSPAPKKRPAPKTRRKVKK
jgi:hypothetical protein